MRGSGVRIPLAAPSNLLRLLIFLVNFCRKPLLASASNKLKIGGERTSRLQSPFTIQLIEIGKEDLTMRLVAIAAASVLLSAIAGTASSMPRGPDLDTQRGLIQVQLQCNASRCIDPRTGVYSYSTCDRYGCRPASGPIGREGGGYRGRGGYDDDRPRRRGWDDGPRYGGGGGGFDCNPSRCIEVGSGRLWESTCDRRGCRPLRPARGQRW